MQAVRKVPRDPGRGVHNSSTRRARVSSRPGCDTSGYQGGQHPYEQRRLCQTRGLWCSEQYSHCSARQRSSGQPVLECVSSEPLVSKLMLTFSAVAPEVIEQSGATTASDIWSVGCTVIELLEGRPPYHFLDPMPALFRIVQDDCPPIPDGASPVVKDFLMQCFQKDCNLRVSAKKLLRHPWMMAAKRQMAGNRSNNASGPERRPVSNYNYDEAVLKVQEWNEALKCERKFHYYRRRFRTFC